MAVFDFNTGLPVTAAPPAPAPKKPYVPAKRKRGTEQGEARKAMLAKVHLAKKSLGMDDDQYRYMLQEQFGVASSKDLSAKQLHDLLLYYQRLGVQFSKGSHRGPGSRRKSVPAILTKDDTGEGRVAMTRKIEALLAEKGRFEGTHVPWEYAVGILKRQTKGRLKSLDQASAEQLEKVLIALIKDAARHGRNAGGWA